MAKKNTKSKGCTVYQDGGTGRYVTKKYAETHKKTTFSHFIKNKSKKGY